MPSRIAKPIDISAAAQKFLGFKSLPTGQHEAIQSLLEGRDTFLVQPADSVGSAVYRIAGSLLAGSTVICSPLIPLQNEKTESTQASEQDESEFIFLTPEQLRDPDTLHRLRLAGVSLFAIEQAHCISHAGHDFRPDYLDLAHVIEALDRPVVLAITATASKEVRAEITGTLGMRDPRVFMDGFDRPNISLRVDLFSEEDEKLEAVVKRVEFAEKPGIVYVATHKHAEFLAKELNGRGVNAASHHGGMKAKDRDDTQERFMSGEVQVVVATNAFGSGVERPDIRFVYHADISDSVEAYYKEIGRAGRDGAPAEAVLFYRPGDIAAQKHKTGTGRVNSADLQAIADALVSKEKSASPRELSHDTGLSQRKIINIIHKLEEVGAAEKLSSGEIQLVQKKSSAQMIEAASEQQQTLKEQRARRLQQMQLYAEGRGCRRTFLLRYFGDDISSSCGNCDRCEEMGGMAIAR